jgi:cyclic beta-1,2-glucan synthetase
MYRLGLEAILGLRQVGNVLRIEPCIPRGWSGYTISYRHAQTQYRISVENPSGVSQGVKKVCLDGERLESHDIPLLEDGTEHQVRVTMG